MNLAPAVIVTVRKVIVGTVLCSATCAVAAPGDQLRKLIADDGARFDYLGWSAAIDDGLALLGARADDDNGDRSGSAYLFDAKSGERLLKLTPDDGARRDDFGRSVALDNGLAVVGAWLDDDDGSGSGSAYLFDVETGEQLHKLTANDGAASDGFGYSVALEESFILVGSMADDDSGSASGSAYLFDAVTGHRLHKFLADDGASSDQFGWSVAMDNGLALIGSPGDDDNGEHSGSAYLFDTESGEQLFKIAPDDGEADDRFGISVALDGNYALVGAIGDNDNGDDSGSAYLFDVTTGKQVLKLSPEDGAAEASFGRVAIKGRFALVGATGSESAYLFDIATGEQLLKLIPDDLTFDGFGRGLDMDGGFALVGAWAGFGNVEDSGTAYLFEVPVIPEPTSALLLLCGLVCVRRRAKPELSS